LYVYATGITDLIKVYKQMRKIASIFFASALLTAVSTAAPAQTGKPVATMIPCCKNGRWGYCNQNKLIVFPCIFDTVYAVDCYMNQRGTMESSDFGIAVLKGKKYDITVEKLIIDDDDPSIKYRLERNTLVKIKDKNKKARPVQTDLPPQQGSIMAEAYTDKNGATQYRLGTATWNGSEYDILAIGADTAMVKKDGKMGIAALIRGTTAIRSWTISPAYTSIDRVAQAIYLTEKNGLKSVWDHDRELIGPVADIRYKLMDGALPPVNNNLPYLVKTGDDYSFYNGEGTALPWGVFEEMNEKSFHKTLIAARKNKKWGIINNAGKTVIPFVYDEVNIHSLECNIIIVKKGEKRGAIDLNGHEYF
jgi:WG containing repeat